ncbi:DEAD/DEAH box helicase [Kocuria soli]|uniref:DEAD/DEAH box helicase n=1 Tax=Kocuria soli TaxID=2485125 RepID=A0A3N3ZPY5_9MICC|nr:DEAD/DEAH box helicase [Kocuria soli]ROZ63093.1 DEAD/DEAH box helicase [Kocuria soli]
MQPTLFGGSAAEMPPAYPERAAWGTAGKLRAWQAEALERYFATQPRDYMAVATPGAGKTTFALRLARELVDRGAINRITVVCPTEHLKRQWADAAARVGLAIDPNFKNADGQHARGYIGVALTYAQVGMKPLLHRARTEQGRTLVIMDEIHHAGDSLSWGDGLREAFEPAAHRLSLTGTPFRSDTAPIPFVTYQEDADGIRRSKADYTYGYGDALKDHVVRPVIFMAYSGQMRWRTSAGEEMAAELGEGFTKSITGHAWRTALAPDGQWIPAVLQGADRRLSEVRRTVPDAGALVIATDHQDAKAYAQLLEKLTGEKPTVVLSDDKEASRRIEEFSEGEQRWMVAVRMVSEGVDVPRLAVGVYATSTSTPLFFAQAVGRFVRARKRGEIASVFLPSVPVLMGHANSMEQERDHALDRPAQDSGEIIDLAETGWDDDALEAANRSERASSELADGKFKALESDASFHGVLFDGGEFGGGVAAGSEEEADYLGIPGLLDAEQVTTLLRERQSEHARKRSNGQSRPQEKSSVPDHRRMKELRQQLAKNVSAWSARTGKPHGVIHNELRKACGGPAVAQATQEQLEARLAKMQNWFIGRK